MDKYLYLAVLFPVLRAETHDGIILRLLRMDDTVMDDFDDVASQRLATEPRFMEDLSKLNLRNPQMSAIWRKLLRSEHPMRMSSSEWSVYTPILHTLPSDITSQINVTDPDVLEYFGTLNVLSYRQLAVFGDRLWSEFGAGLLTDDERMTRMGNLLCGFNAAFLDELPYHTFRALHDRGAFKKISCCNAEQLRSLLHVGVKFGVFGPPATWNTKTVTTLGYLIAGLDASQMRKMRDDSMRGITPNVIRATSVHTLKNMRQEQLKALNTASMLAWRRRTRDVTYLLSSATTVSLTSCLISLSSHIAADNVLIC